MATTMAMSCGVVGRVTNFAPSASARRGGSTLRGAVARGVVVRRRDCKRSVRLGALGPDAVEALTQLAPHVEAALRVLLQGCTEGPDLQLQRQCFLVLHRLVEEWCAAGPAHHSSTSR